MQRKNYALKTVIAVILLLLELFLVFLPVFNGTTALTICRQIWANGSILIRIVIPLLLLICPVISIVFLWQLRTATAADTPVAASDITTDTSEDETTDCARITFLSGPLQGQSFPLPAYETINLGRSSQICQIVINSADISRHHVTICYHATRHTFIITDHSANGTYSVDGERLIPNTSIEVPDGSIFSLGNKVTSFRLLAHTEVYL